jgi:hypothetical protein
MDAPAEVLAEMAAMALPVRFGLGVDLTGGMPVHRLYLHSRCPKTRAGRYRCWRWRPGEGASVADYLFHFLPETADGMRPENLVPDALRPAVTEMLGTDRLRQGSGFWLRRSATGLVDQVDLAFPWYPAAGSLPGLAGLIGHFGLADERRAAGTADWRDLPVRHVAVGTGPRAGTAALYVSAPVSGPLPESEAALQRQVRDGAVRLRDTLEEAVYRRLPSLAPPPLSRLRAPCRWTGSTAATRTPGGGYLGHGCTITTACSTRQRTATTRGMGASRRTGTASLRRWTALSPSFTRLSRRADGSTTSAAAGAARSPCGSATWAARPLA